MKEHPHSDDEGETLAKDVKEAGLQAELKAWKEELRLAHAKANDYLQSLQYLQAEFDNYRKRVERDRDETNRVVADRLLVSLLDVYDELQIAIDVAKKSDDKETVVSGLGMVLRKLEALFASQGMKPIEAVGKKFDPNIHEAIEAAPPTDDGLISEEVRRGFMLRGKVIRSSLVKVGAANPESSDGDSRSD